MSEPKVSLTFDNGPTVGVTDRVLDILGERGILATFFVIGANYALPGTRALSERAVEAGHRIGNHTFTHTVQFGDHPDPEFGAKEIDAAQAAIGELAAEEKYFRPYGGGGVLSRSVFTSRAVEHLSRQRYTCVLWNSVPHDWDEPDRWVGRALADVEAQPWTVVVVHDQDTGAMVHLESFLDGLAKCGAELRRDFPDDCVPLRRGEPHGSLQHLMPLADDAQARRRPSEHELPARTSR